MHTFFPYLDSICPFLEQVRMCLVVIGGQIASKLEMVFLFHSRDSRSCNEICSITTKQHNCWFLVPKRNVKNVAAGFALFTVVEPCRFIG